MPNRFYRRRWDETRGDEFDGWGHSVWFFEAGEDGWPVRQVEVYDAGRVLRYGPRQPEDRFGGLGEASLFDSGDEWSGFEITETEFERVWHSDGQWRPDRPSVPGPRQMSAGAGGSSLRHASRDVGTTRRTPGIG